MLYIIIHALVTLALRLQRYDFFLITKKNLFKNQILGIFG